MKYIAIVIMIFSFLPVRGQDINDVLLKTRACIDDGRYDDAVAMFSSELDSRADYRLLTGRGEAYLFSGEADKAILDFVLANSLNPASGDFGLARAYAIKGMADESVKWLSRHLKSPFKLERQVIMLDKYLTEIEESQQWRKIWKTEWYTQLERGEAEIEYLLKSDRIKDAEKVYNELATIYSDRVEVVYLDGIIALKKNDYKTAAEKLRVATEDEEGSYKTWIAYINALNSIRNYLYAANICNEAMTIFPDKPELLLLRAKNLREAGDRDKALETAELFLELYPANEKAIQLAGMVAYENKQYGSSLKYFSRNIENHPGNAEFFADRAGVYMKTRSWDAAIYDFSMSLDLQPRNGEVYYLKGMALMNTAKPEEACHDFKMALRYAYKKASVMISKHCIR